MRTYINFCGKCKTQLRFELEGPISERVKVPCNLCGNDKTEVYEAPASDLPGDERSPEVTLQMLNDARINPFAVELLVESFKRTAGEDRKLFKFTFQGVEISLRVK